MDDSGIEALAAVLNATRIDQLYLLYSSAGDRGGVKLAETLAGMPMNRLVLEGFQVGDATVRALAGVVQNNPALAELWVDGNEITDAGAIFFAQMIQNSSLDTLGLRSLRMTDAGVIALANVAVTLPLKKIVVGSQSGETGILALVNQLNKTNLFQMVLWYNTFTLHTMEVLAGVLPTTSITVLIFGYNHLNQDAVSRLAPGIAASSVNVLAIYGNDLSDSVALFGASFSKLALFQIIEGNLTDASLIALTPFLPGSSLQVIDFDINQIGDEGILALAGVLPDSQVVSLYLYSNHITSRGAQALADIYSETPLQYLRLVGNPIALDVLYQVENFRWQQYCRDQLCYANVSWHDSGAGSAPGQRQPGKNLSHPIPKNLWSPCPLRVLPATGGTFIRDLIYAK